MVVKMRSSHHPWRYLSHALAVAMLIGTVALPRAVAFTGEATLLTPVPKADKQRLATLVNKGDVTTLKHVLFHRATNHHHTPDPNAEPVIPYGLSRADAFYLMGVAQTKAQKPHQAFIWYQKAAQLNHPWAQYQLSKVYMDERTPLKQNKPLALALLKKAANSNVPDAQLDLAMAYETGRKGLTQDIPAAVTYYQKAALNHHALAQYALGYLYEKGNGVEKDIPMAFHWYKKSADRGISAAQYKTGLFYLIDTEAGKQNVAAGKQYLEKAARQNHVEAALQLGLIYEEKFTEHPANATDADYTNALQWFRRAANLGDPNGQMAVGTYYLMGWGTNQDMTEALKWFKASAKQGNDSAKDWLAIVQKDLNEADDTHLATQTHQE